MPSLASTLILPTFSSNHSLGTSHNVDISNLQLLTSARTTRCDAPKGRGLPAREPQLVSVWKLVSL